MFYERQEPTGVSLLVKYTPIHFNLITQEVYEEKIVKKEKELFQTIIEVINENKSVSLSKSVEKLVHEIKRSPQTNYAKKEIENSSNSALCCLPTLQG